MTAPNGPTSTRRCGRAPLVVVALVALLAVAGTACRPAPGIGAAGPIGRLRSEGRWLVDRTGRVVTLHGVNEVAKQAPYSTPVRRLDEVKATRRPVVRQPL